MKPYHITLKSLFLFITAVLITSCSSVKIRDEAFDPEVYFKRANELIAEGHYDDAREVLEDIRAKDATLQYATLAGIRIADTYYEQGEYEEAVAGYEGFLDIHPYHKYSPYAQYKLAMSYYQRIKTVDVSYTWAKNALKEFRKLRRRYPRNPYMDITDTRIKTCRNVLAGYEFYVGRFYYKKGSYRSAAQRFNGLVENYSGSAKEPDALYYLALSYDNMGQKQKAVDTLNLLIEKFPNMELVAEARDLLADFKKEK